MQVVAGTAISAIRRSVSYVLLLMFELSLLQQVLVGGFNMLLRKYGVTVLKAGICRAVFIISVAVVHLLAEIFLAMDHSILELIRETQYVSARQNRRILIYLLAQLLQLLADLLHAVFLAVVPLDQQSDQCEDAVTADYGRDDGCCCIQWLFLLLRVGATEAAPSELSY